MDIKKEYERWLANATADADVAAELKTLDDAKIEDAFYRDLNPLKHLLKRCCHSSGGRILISDSSPNVLKIPSVLHHTDGIFIF